jgi:hypothetical protein
MFECLRVLFFENLLKNTGVELQFVKFEAKNIHCKFVAEHQVTKVFKSLVFVGAKS